MQRENVFSFVDNEAEVRKFMTNVYAWMAIGIFITGIAAYLTAASPVLMSIIAGSPLVYIGLIAVEFILVIYLSRNVMRMDTGRAGFFFILYSIINGLTISFIFLAYEMGSIASVFFMTAGTFAVMSAYGFFTKRDLTSWGNILFMGLVGIIIASVVNIFLRSSMFSLIISYIGVGVFVGLTAFDTQKIKNFYLQGANSSEIAKRMSILGALILYLDFVNLFLFLLRIFGRRD